MKRIVFDTLLHSPLYPHIWFCGNPFKIVEFEHLMRGLSFKPTDVALDIGCGVGLQTSLLAKRCGKVIGIDISPQVIGRAESDQRHIQGRLPVEFRCTTIEAARFPDEYFDKIMSVCVIEHIPDHDSVFRECCRTLKQGGQLTASLDSLATVDDEELKQRHKREHAVQHYFSPGEVREKLQNAGFKEVTVMPLFCSDFARDLFKRGIRESFRFRYVEAIQLSRRLVEEEARCTSKENGLFLLARASK